MNSNYSPASSSSTYNSPSSSNNFASPPQSSDNNDDYGSPAASPISTGYSSASSSSSNSYASPSQPSSSEPSNDDYGAPSSSSISTGYSSSSSASSSSFAAPSQPSNDDYGSPVASPVSTPQETYSSAGSTVIASTHIEPSSYASIPTSNDFSGAATNDFENVAISTAGSDEYGAPSGDIGVVAPSNDDYGAPGGPLNTDFAIPSGDFNAASNDYSSVPNEDYGAPTNTGVSDEYGAPPNTDYTIPGGDPNISSNDYNTPTEDYGVPNVSNEYGAPTGEIFTGVESDVVETNYDEVPVYKPIDTNSIESGLGVPEYDDYIDDEPLTSYISVSSLGDSYGGPRENVQDVVILKDDRNPLDEVYEDNESVYAYDNYEDELPTYIIPSSDTYNYQDGPSIEYASPRDFNDIESAPVAASEDSLVIDLTSNKDNLNIDYDTEVGDISPVYGQRLGASSKSHSSHNLLSQIRRHRQRWSV